MSWILKQVGPVAAELNEIRRTSPETHLHILEAIADLRHNPRPPDSDPLRGQKDMYRIKVGRYRVVYAVRGKTVLITRVRDRGTAYEGLFPLDDQEAD